MPTNVASLITGATYPSVINIPANGETLTEAAEINTTVALGDRIEYIYRRTPDLALKPEQLFIFREDFIFGAADFVNLELHADKHWIWTATGPGSLSFSPGGGKNPGNLDFLLNGASLQSFQVRPRGIQTLINFASIEQLTVVAKVNDAVGNTLSTLDVGLSALSSDAMRLQYSGSDHTHWKFFSRKNAGGVQSTTNIGTLTMGAYVVMDVLANAAGDLVVSANGTPAVTIPFASRPGDAGTIDIQVSHNSADPGAFASSIDFIYVRGLIADRSGV